MIDESAERIEKLELHVATLERQVEQLNDVLVEQGKALDKLKHQLRRVSETIETHELERIKSTNPKPPHYQ